MGKKQNRFLIIRLSNENISNGIYDKILALGDKCKGAGLKSLNSVLNNNLELIVGAVEEEIANKAAATTPD